MMSYLVHCGQDRQHCDFSTTARVARALKFINARHNIIGQWRHRPPLPSRLLAIKGRCVGVKSLSGASADLLLIQRDMDCYFSSSDHKQWGIRLHSVPFPGSREGSYLGSWKSFKVSKKNGNHTRIQRYLVLWIAVDITTVENTRVENKPPRSSWQLERQWRLSTILATYKCTQYPTASSKHSHYDAENLPSGVRDLVLGLGARTELTRIVTMHP